jgi:hypothetical protein
MQGIEKEVNIKVFTFSPAARINPAKLNAKPKQCVPIGLLRLSMVSYKAMHGVSCNTSEVMISDYNVT